VPELTPELVRGIEIATALIVTDWGSAKDMALLFSLV
jgi:hypothetical protein